MKKEIREEDFDIVDSSIIEALREDGTKTHIDISKNLNLTAGGVRYRVSGLLKRGSLKIRGLINPFMSKTHSFFYVGITFSDRKSGAKTIQALSEYPEVFSVTSVSGRFDLMIEIYTPKDSYVELLARIDGNPNIAISMVETFVCFGSPNKWI
ncbi:MAG: DNA-binding Lrp family transcriptional regulator [Candidatus Marinamargulisbacteria bacterium]|jgi:DNA-binding Lrp family transcriptional regulator